MSEEVKGEVAVVAANPFMVIELHPKVTTFVSQGCGRQESESCA